MSILSPKRLEKKRAREKADRARMLIARKRKAKPKRRQASTPYPSFTFEASDAPSGFVELVRGALASIDFDDRNQFPTWLAEYYRIVKSDGNAEAVAFLARLRSWLEARGDKSPVSPEMIAGNRLGQLVFDRIPRNSLLRYVPFNDVVIQPEGNDIVVRFRSLLRAKGRRGTIYYSKYRPTLEIDGVPRVVGFSKHAIERICLRRCSGWDAYAGLGDAFGFFHECLYYERSDLYKNQLGFTFYDKCEAPPFWTCLYSEVLGSGVDLSSGKFYYRVGYCLADIDGDFIKAISFLYPGYRSTPEYGLLIRSRLPSREKTNLIQKAEHQQSFTDVENGQFDIGLVKWFHDHGVPQVREFRNKLHARAGW